MSKLPPRNHKYLINTIPSAAETVHWYHDHLRTRSADYSLSPSSSPLLTDENHGSLSAELSGWH